jgi:hypothetical protein
MKLIRIVDVKASGKLLVLESAEATNNIATTITEGLLNDKKVYIDIVPDKRSLNANNYMWVLCDAIAKKINSTREDVYRQAIRECGVFTDMSVKDEALIEFQNHWNNKGIGWFTEVIGEGALRGYTDVRAYYGSSSYTSAEMSMLLDYIVEAAKENGIETMTDAEINSLIEQWGGKNEKPKG